MARQSAATKAKTLRVLPARDLREAPVLTLEQAARIYRELLDQSDQLQASLQELREHILRAMSDLGASDVRADGFEVVRQVRHREPVLDVDKAERILRRFNRLQECLVPTLDERKARDVIEDLRADGKIKAAEMPLEYRPETEALIVRRV